MKNNGRTRSPILLLKRTTLLLFLFWISAAQFLCAQTQKITGTVTDSYGDPLIYVSVVVLGTTRGTVTDMDGNFEIEASMNEVLQVKYVGFATREVKITGTNLQIQLNEDTQNLEEVVVIGYGSMKKSDISAAITSVSSEAIEMKNAISVADALQGMAPGLQINMASGAPGAESYIKIRGASTFDDSGASPLFVVDGVIVEDIDNINPNDIKGIEVLKDGASAAIYGARSANGVIIITTKSGEVGKPKVDIRYSRSYNTVSRKLPQVNAFESRLSMAATDLVNASKILEKFSDRTDSVGLQYSTNYFYQDLLFRTGTRDNVSATVSGGNKDFKYRAALAYDGVNGVILTSYNKRYTGTVTMDYNATQNLSFNTYIRLGNQRYNAISEGNVLQGAMRRDPDMIIWYPDGELIPYYESGGRRNPIAELEQRKDVTDRYTGVFTQGMNWRFLPYLSLSGTITGDFTFKRREQFVSKYLQGSNNGANSGSDNTDWIQKYSGDIYLNYNKSFGDHNLSGTFGSSFDVSNTDLFRYKGSYFVSEEITTMNMASVTDISGTNTGGTGYSTVGIFGRLGYSWKSRYILQGTIRRDGSSRFGPESRWGWFPSASFAWRFSDEFFMDWSDNYLTDGKLRVSYGVTGNDKVGNYESITSYRSGSYYYDGVSGVVPNTKYGNPALKWEETRQTNFGVDLSFIGGRVNFVADYYIKSTKDLLSDMNVPYTTGYTTMRVNLASLENRGIELSLMAIPVRTKDVTWSTTLNWWKNKNKITDLSREDYVQSNIWLVAKGEQAGLWYGYNNQGVYQYDFSNAYTDDYKTRLTPNLERDKNGNVIIGLDGQPTLINYLNPDGSVYNGEVKKLTKGGVELAGGDVIWENLPDANGNYDGVIDDNDRQILGKATPQWFASWMNTVSYKNFSLTCNFYVSWGGLVYNYLKRYYTSWGGNTHKQHPEYVLTGWKYQGQITNWYALDSRQRSTANETQELNSMFLEDGSFIRLQNLRLTYDLEQKWTTRTPLSSCQVYIYGNNLVTWTNYSGYDPEVTGSVLTPGRDSSNYPRSREFGFGLNIVF